MTATTMTDLDLLRARMAAAVGGQLPGHVRRLGWSPAELAAFQRDRLRALLARAIERSPFHAARLRGVDPGRFELADLPGLPVMTKAQMMENFDAAVTDRRLTRNLVEQHLAASAAEPSLLLGEYVCLLSGGSSGCRGLVVQTVSEYADFVATINRRAMAEAMTEAITGAITGAGPPPEGLVIGIVGAGTPVHSSGLGAATAVAPPVRMIPAPASLPTAEIVRRLNAARPPALLAYAAKLAELAREQRAGRLRLNLRSVTSMAEMLSPAERTAIGEAFGVPVIDLFVSTEGLVGRSEPGSSVLTFASDTCLAECVDDEGRPVPDCVASSRVLVTNLHNLTQPLIRYELTDRFTPAANPAGGFLRASVDGRADDLFRYPAASVHPFVIGTPLLRAPAVREFQVRQTERGADLAVVADGDLDVAALTAGVRDGLRQAGLPGPQVTLRRVEALDRDPLTGKARRFIPLGWSPTVSPRAADTP
jgi:phenylacetate-coenzyme A ligase PaaK-like adenylate-forming protein